MGSNNKVSLNKVKEVIMWMIDNQLGRRNLPDYARVELNLRKEDIIGVGQGYRSDLSPNGEKFNTEKKLAEISQVGQGTIQRVKFIRDNADEETKSKLRAGNKESYGKVRELEIK